MGREGSNFFRDRQNQAAILLTENAKRAREKAAAETDWRSDVYREYNTVPLIIFLSSICCCLTVAGIAFYPRFGEFVNSVIRMLPYLKP